MKTANQANNQIMAITYGDLECRERFIFSSCVMLEILEKAEKFAQSDISVLIEGENGVGKDVIARYIYAKSSRAGRPFIQVNCGSIPETLFESEFFGFEKGSFTNALRDHRGYFERANNGTIVIDEISEIPYHLQVKLLHVFEDRSIYRVGSEKRIPLDIRIIATTNSNLKSLVHEKKFRQDLYYRLASCTIFVPPLRERKDDIKVLSEHFVRKYSNGTKYLSLGAYNKLLDHGWPGNIRELDACIHQSILLTNGKASIDIDDIKLDNPIYKNNHRELQIIVDTLQQFNGCINKSARYLHVHRNTLYYYIKKHQIDINNIRTSLLLRNNQK
ncbi:MAG: sigma-54-dependent Fis family transcriptional regulator [Ignavibacteriales bacterium]|nr:sigma-54-dependent Fis family transcriptional regulator [Ignavibacteriales bacterium]